MRSSRLLSSITADSRCLNLLEYVSTIRDEGPIHSSYFLRSLRHNLVNPIFTIAEKAVAIAAAKSKDVISISANDHYMLRHDIKLYLRKKSSYRICEGVTKFPMLLAGHSLVATFCL